MFVPSHKDSTISVRLTGCVSVVFSPKLTRFQGSAVKTGSSALVMSIVGAALIPLVMSAVADAAGINVALLLAVPGFLYVAWYGLFGSKLGLERK